MSEDDLRFKRYEAGPDPRAPIRVGFSAYAVDIPRCGQAWASLASNRDNQVTPNFGCAVTANIAAMVAKPSDLMFPQPSTPLDATRRQVVLEKYRQGAVTSSAKDDQAQGQVSHAVN
jgi:pilus assembly protein CpaD